MTKEDIVGTAALVAGIDPVYTAIAGNWEESRIFPSIELLLDQNVRGKDLGKQLLEHLLTVATCQGIKDVRIDTFPTNHPMEKRYTRRVFIIVA